MLAVFGLVRTGAGLTVILKLLLLIPAQLSLLALIKTVMVAVLELPVVFFASNGQYLHVTNQMHLNLMSKEIHKI